MAKFKVGDKVTDGYSVFQITKVTPMDYKWKLVKGSGTYDGGKSCKDGGEIGWADDKMVKYRSLSSFTNSAPRTSNPVVQNALAARAMNAKGAAGQEIKVGDKVEWIDNGEHSGTVTLVDYNRIIVDRKYRVDAIDVWPKGKCPFINSAVVANAGDKKCKVTLETVTFNQGVKPETRHMSIPELRTLLKMLGKGSDAEAFIQRLETSGATDIAINDVDLYAALI